MSSPKTVVVHPLVLLSVVDHYNRVARDTKKRVVGVLLGEATRDSVDVTNSYAVPFEEDEHNPKVWFLDHNFHENMHSMFRKVNAAEKVIGWYSSGPKIRTADLDIHKLMQRFCPKPVLVIINVNQEDERSGLPTEAYITVEEVSEETQEVTQQFVHVSSEIGAVEAEEVGVEHLLRDVKDISVSTLTNRIEEKVASLKSLAGRLTEISAYLALVYQGKLPMNHHIISQVQDIYNLLPNIATPELSGALMTKTNDMGVVVYLSSVIRTVVVLHDLILNKLALISKEEGEDDGPKKKKEVKEVKPKENGEKMEVEKKK